MIIVFTLVHIVYTTRMKDLGKDFSMRYSMCKIELVWGHYNWNSTRYNLDTSFLPEGKTPCSKFILGQRISLWKYHGTYKVSMELDLESSYLKLYDMGEKTHVAVRDKNEKTI